MDKQTIQDNIRNLNNKLNAMINKMKKRNTVKNNRPQVNHRNTRAGRLNLMPATGSRVRRMAANIEAKVAAQR
jgi:hypothetical protein